MNFLALALTCVLSASAKEAVVAAPKAVVADPAMERWMKFAAPGEEHKRLNFMVGRWSHTVKMWMSPEAPAGVSQGTTQNEWILGGRYLQNSSDGLAMGQKFEGRGVTAFDNLRQQYISTWIDTMGTGVMVSAGGYDAASNSILQTGTYSQPATNEKERWFRSVWKFIDNDHYSYETFEKSPAGKEFRTMEIQYSRLK